MNAELMARCDLLVRNRAAIHAAFKWDSDLMSLAGSSFYVGLYREADAEQLKECEKILKKKAGIFSEFRGNVRMPLLCKMAVLADPGQYIDDLRGIMSHMKKMTWIDGSYKILAAMTIYDHSEPAQYEAAVEKMGTLYQKMKAEHPWLTGGEDVPFAAMLAVSDFSEDALVTEMEACYQELKKHFHDKNAVQSLSHVLAADRSPAEEKCRKVEMIFDALKEKKHKYGTGYELAVLGTLAILDLSPDAIAQEIIEADEYLKTQKGFGTLAMGDKNRRMYAALMVMDTHVPPAARSHESLLDSVLAVVIAMEICMIIMMTTICTTTSVS